VQRNRAYLIIVLLSRVVTRLGTLSDMNTGVVENLFAGDLRFDFFGWPFSFWVGAQGALIVYMVLIWFYARTMNRLDQEHNVAEEI
jgi:putative solute:sodium symporter small subunit